MADIERESVPRCRMTGESSDVVRFPTELGSIPSPGGMVEA